MISNINKEFEKGFVKGDHGEGNAGLFPSSLIDDLTPAEDFGLCIEIEEALCEKEIMLLRRKLENLNKQNEVPFTNEHSMDAEAYFGLSEEMFNPVKLNIEGEGNEVGNYLQKLHIKNHSISAKEQVHDLLAEGVELPELDIQLMSPEDEILFEDVREAVTEKEIIDLRANLQSIAQSTSIHERTFEEIEDLVSGELDDEIANMIREEARMNPALSIEIDLHQEINSSIEEQDVVALRASLKELIRNGYSHSHNVAEIDGYLNDELDEQTLALFEDELIANSGLAADLAFHKEVDKAIAESDIMTLRASLKDISFTQRSLPDEKLGVASPKKKSLFWYAAASVLLLMFVFASLVRNKVYSSQQLYAAYYQPYKSAETVSRSAVNSNNSLGAALREIDHGNYQSALKYLKDNAGTEADGFSINFYSGVSYQELGEYNSAISSFSEVVRHGDNLLVEQSEWYIGLCYLRIDEREKALAQFRSIVSRKGFYEEQSSKLLKQME